MKDILNIMSLANDPSGVDCGIRDWLTGTSRLNRNEYHYLGCYHPIISIDVKFKIMITLLIAKMRKLK